MRFQKEFQPGPPGLQRQPAQIAPLSFEQIVGHKRAGHLCTQLFADLPAADPPRERLEAEELSVAERENLPVEDGAGWQVAGGGEQFWKG